MNETRYSEKELERMVDQATPQQLASLLKIGRRGETKKVNVKQMTNAELEIVGICIPAIYLDGPRTFDELYDNVDCTWPANSEIPTREFVRNCIDKSKLLVEKNGRYHVKNIKLLTTLLSGGKYA